MANFTGQDLNTQEIEPGSPGAVAALGIEQPLDSGVPVTPSGLNLCASGVEQGGGDQTPPTIAFTPNTGATIAPADTLIVTVFDNDQIEEALPFGVAIYANYPTLSRTELVYDGSAFAAPYSGSVVETTPAPGQTIEYTVGRTPGWTSHPLTLLVVAYDVAGNQKLGSASYTVDPDPTPPTVETEPPVVDNFVPVPGTQLNRNDSVSFDVTDNSGTLGRVLVAVSFPETGEVELVYDGVAFTPKYANQSVRTTIAQGFNFDLRRFGGWPAAVTATIRVWAVDPSGNLES